jgi:hypothetical protein
MKSILGWWHRPVDGTKESIIKEFKELLKEHPKTYSSEWADKVYMDNSMKRIAQETFNPHY